MVWIRRCNPLPADPKPAKRIKDPDALRVARLSGDECAACGVRAESVHHVIPKGERGDDVPGNLLLLCGHGTAKCHGAEHGNPYTVEIDVFGKDPALAVRRERRDSAWVHARIGKHIVKHRPDTIAYVEAKLGVEAGHAYLERRYLIDPGVWELLEKRLAPVGL